MLYKAHNFTRIYIYRCRAYHNKSRSNFLQNILKARSPNLFRLGPSIHIWDQRADIQLCNVDFRHHSFNLWLQKGQHGQEREIRHQISSFTFPKSLARAWQASSSWSTNIRWRQRSCSFRHLTSRVIPEAKPWRSPFTTSIWKQIMH